MKTISLLSILLVMSVSRTESQRVCVSSVDDCRVDPCTCKSGGICVAPDYKTCACNTQFTGYAGDYCSIPQCDDMNKFPYGCRTGRCVSPNTCDCTGTGFTGIDCNIPICETACAHGKCVGPNTCDCINTGYAGSLCEIPQCEPPCQNGGTCVGPSTCDCSTTPTRGGLLGFNGTHCEFAICEPPCQHNGRCSGPNQCACENTGYAGPLCQYDENECLRFENPCDKRTTCTNTIGSFECSPCPSGLYGSPYMSKGGCQTTPVEPVTTGGMESTSSKIHTSTSGAKHTGPVDKSNPPQPTPEKNSSISLSLFTLLSAICLIAVNS